MAVVILSCNWCAMCTLGKWRAVGIVVQLLIYDGHASLVAVAAWTVLLCGTVWRCVALCGAVWRCVALCGAVWRCVALCGAVWRCVALCGAVWRCVALITTTLFSIYMFKCYTLS